MVHGTVLLPVLTLAHGFGYLSLLLNAVHSVFPVLNYMVQTVYVFILLSVVWMGSLVYEWPTGGQLRCLGSSSFVPFFLTSRANLTPLQWITTYTESCFPHRRALIKSHRRLEKVSMGVPQQNSKCWKVMQAVCFGKRIVASQSEKGILGNICVNLVTYKVPTLLASGQPTSAGPTLKTRNLWEQLEWQKEPRLLNLVDLCILTTMQSDLEQDP